MRADDNSASPAADHEQRQRLPSYIELPMVVEVGARFVNSCVLLDANPALVMRQLELMRPGSGPR